MAAVPGQLTVEQWKKRSNFLRALRWLTTNRDEDLTPEALIDQFTVYVQENARTGKVTAQMNHDVVFSEFVTSKYRDPNTPEWFWSHEKKGGAEWKLNPQGLGKKRRERTRKLEWHRAVERLEEDRSAEQGSEPKRRKAA